MPPIDTIPAMSHNRSSDENTDNMLDSHLLQPKEFSPFSSNRVLRQSDTPHSKENPNDEEDDNTILPGDKTEMKNFCELSTKSSRIQIKVCVPLVALQIK